MFASGAGLCPLGLGPAKQGFAGGNVRATASAISSNLSGNFLGGGNVTEDVCPSPAEEDDLALQGQDNRLGETWLNASAGRESPGSDGKL